MPTYSYRCTACENQFDAFHAISAESLTICPKCNKKTLERLIGRGAGIVFKGKGFYVTDYKKDSQKKTEVKETKATTDKKNQTSTTKSDQNSNKQVKSEQSKGNKKKANTVAAQ